MSEAGAAGATGEAGAAVEARAPGAPGTPSVRDALAEIAAQPVAEWRPLLARRFPRQPLLVQQALLWLHASDTHGRRDARPSLGAVGDARYELALKLDSGATASVWQAYDRKLGRNVAIKILHAVDGDAKLAQLLLEALAAAAAERDDARRTLTQLQQDQTPLASRPGPESAAEQRAVGARQ